MMILKKKQKAMMLQMSDLKYNRKYQPLFRTKKNIRYKHVKGGRGSGKSHALSVYLLMKTYNKGEVILYTRYTMVSASLSIIPEFYEKIEFIDHVKIGKINNYKGIDKSIDWNLFLKDSVNLCRCMNIKFYIKKDLQLYNNNSVYLNENEINMDYLNLQYGIR